MLKKMNVMDLVEKLLKYDGVLRAVAPIIENIAMFTGRITMTIFRKVVPSTVLKQKVTYTFTYRYRSDNPTTFVTALYDRVEMICGLSTRDFYYTGEETYVDPTNLGNEDFGITVSRESKEDSRSQPMTSLVLYSTIHTRDSFKELIGTIVNASQNIVTSPVNIIARNQYDDFVFMIVDDIPRVPLPASGFIHREVTKKITDHVLTNKMGNYMLHGPPGTGKTTIIRQVASAVGATVISISLDDFSNRFRFLEFLATTKFTIHKNDDDYIIKPKVRFVIFEDFDTMVPATFWRPDLAKPGVPASHLGYTFSDLLNILDGVAKINGMYTFWTTNHVDVTPPSFYRSGRMSIREHIDLLPAEDAEMILGYAPTEEMRLAQVISLKIDGVALTIEEIEAEAALAIPKVEESDSKDEL